MVGAWLPQILVPCRAPELSPLQRRTMLEELEEGGSAMTYFHGGFSASMLV